VRAVNDTGAWGYMEGMKGMSGTGYNNLLLKDKKEYLCAPTQRVYARVLGLSVGVVAALLSGLFVPGLAQAVTEDSGRPNVVYVNDMIYINLRAGRQSGSETIKVIPTGTRLTVLERPEGGESLRVRLDSGEEGWVQSQYLTELPVARDRIGPLEARVQQLEEERTELRKQLAAATDDKKRLQAGQSNQDQEVSRLSRELEELRAISGEAVATHAENQTLKQQQMALDREVKQLKAEKNELRGRITMVGIGAAVVALIIGFYIGYTPVRNQKRWQRLP
jgi:SH3 domain protein